MGNGHAASVQSGWSRHDSRQDIRCVSAGGFAARKTAKPPIPATRTTAARVTIRLVMIGLPAAVGLVERASFLVVCFSRSAGNVVGATLVVARFENPAPYRNLGPRRSHSPPTGFWFRRINR